MDLFLNLVLLRKCSDHEFTICSKINSFPASDKFKMDVSEIWLCFLNDPTTSSYYDRFNIILRPTHCLCSSIMPALEKNSFEGQITLLQCLFYFVHSSTLEKGVS